MYIHKKATKCPGTNGVIVNDVILSQSGSIYE